MRVSDTMLGTHLQDSPDIPLAEVQAESVPSE